MNRSPASKQGSPLRRLPRASPTPRSTTASPCVHSMSTNKSGTPSSRGESPRPQTGFSSRLVNQFLRVNKKKQPKHKQLRRRSHTDVIAVIITLKYLMRDKHNKNGCFSSRRLLKVLVQLDMDDSFAMRFASALATCEVIEPVDGMTEVASSGSRTFDNSKRHYWRWAQWASIAEIGAVSTCSAEILEGNILGDVDLCIQYPNVNVEHEDFCLFFRINALSNVSIRGKQLSFCFDEPSKPLHHDKWCFELLDNFEFLETLQNLLRFWEPIQHMEALLAECAQPLFIRPCTPAAAAIRHRHPSLQRSASTSRSSSRSGSQAQDLGLWRCPASPSSAVASTQDQQQQGKHHRSSEDTEFPPIASAAGPQQQQQRHPTSGCSPGLSASSSSSSFFQPIATSRGSPATAEDRAPGSPLAQRTTSTDAPAATPSFPTPAPAPAAVAADASSATSSHGSDPAAPVSAAPPPRPSRLSTSTGSQGEGVRSSPLARGPRISKTTGAGLALPPRLSASGHATDLDKDAARCSPKPSNHPCPTEHSPLQSARSSIASSRSSAANVFESYPPAHPQHMQHRAPQGPPPHHPYHHRRDDRRATSLRETVRDFSRNGAGVRSASPPVFSSRASSLHSQSHSTAEYPHRRRGYTVTHCAPSTAAGGGSGGRSDHIYEELGNFQGEMAFQPQSDGMGAFNSLHRINDRRSLDGSSSPAAFTHAQPRLSLEDPIARERHKSWRVHGGHHRHQQTLGGRPQPSRSLDVRDVEFERRRASEGAEGRGREYSGAYHHTRTHHRRSLRSPSRMSASSPITTCGVGEADMSRATVSASRATNDPPPPPPPPRPAHLKPLPPNSHIYDNTRPHERAKQLQDSAACGSGSGASVGSPTARTTATDMCTGGKSGTKDAQGQGQGLTAPHFSAVANAQGATVTPGSFSGCMQPTPPPMGSLTASTTTARGSASTITAESTSAAQQTPPALLDASHGRDQLPQQQQDQQHTYLSLSELSDATVYVV